MIQSTKRKQKLLFTNTTMLASELVGLPLKCCLLKIKQHLNFVLTAGGSNTGIQSTNEQCFPSQGKNGVAFLGLTGELTW